LAKAACIWRPLAGCPDELDIEGLAFYKKLFGLGQNGLPGDLEVQNHVVERV